MKEAVWQIGVEQEQIRGDLTVGRSQSTSDLGIHFAGCKRYEAYVLDMN
jgi:hypothetical protein